MKPEGLTCTFCYQAHLNRTDDFHCLCPCHQSTEAKVQVETHEKDGEITKIVANGIEVFRENPLEWRRSEFTAMNIVNQIGDLLYETLPPDIAHEHFVKARQATNDRATDFAEKLIEEHISHLLSSQRERCAGVVEGMKAGGYEHLSPEMKRLYEHGNELLTDAADKIRKTPL